MNDFLEIFDFDKICADADSYLSAKEIIKSRLGTDYSQRKTEVLIKLSGREIKTTLGTVLVNLLILKPFIECGEKVIVDDLYLGKTMTQENLDVYFNYVLSRLSQLNVDYNSIRRSIIDAMDEMCDLSGEYNVKTGNSISFRDFVRLEVEDEEARKLFKSEVKPGSYDQIEAQFNEHGKQLLNYFKEHKDTELHPFVASDTGINKKQFQQMAGWVGLKPDADGTVIPVTVTDNFLHGLSSLESYFINSKGTRKALMTNQRMTKKSGYLTRKLSLSNIDHYHDNTIDDCGTTHFVVFNVDSKRKLRQIIGRHYYDLDANNEKASDLKTVTEFSTDLIGKKIGLRSPVTCCGEHVCATCYGKQLSEINKDINTGLAATLKLTEPLTQRLLSAKHLLSTKTDKVDWGEGFEEVFSVNMDSIYFIEGVDCSVSFRKPTSEEYDEDEEAYYTTSLKILLEGSKKAIEYESPVRLYINEKLLPTEKVKDDDEDITVVSKNSNIEEYIFRYRPKNNELTQSLQEILDLIENSDHLGITNYSDFVNKFDDLLIENELDYINSVHIEMISSVLIRDAKTGKRLDFSKKDLDDYVIARVSKSVMDGPLAVSLSFERLNDQLINLETYEKDGVSMMDYLFM